MDAHRAGGPNTSTTPGCNTWRRTPWGSAAPVSQPHPAKQKPVHPPRSNVFAVGQVDCWCNPRKLALAVGLSGVPAQHGVGRGCVRTTSSMTPVPRLLKLGHVPRHQGTGSGGPQACAWSATRLPKALNLRCHDLAAPPRESPGCLPLPPQPWAKLWPQTPPFQRARTEHGSAAAAALSPTSRDRCVGRVGAQLPTGPQRPVLSDKLRAETMGTLANGEPEPKKAKIELHQNHVVVLVLDYGSQYTQLICRRWGWQDRGSKPLERQPLLSRHDGRMAVDPDVRFATTPPGLPLPRVAGSASWAYSA